MLVHRFALINSLVQRSIFQQTNKQTNALLLIKTPTMSSKINKKSQYTIDSHNNFFIG